MSFQTILGFLYFFPQNYFLAALSPLSPLHRCKTVGPRLEGVQSIERREGGEMLRVLSRPLGGLRGWKVVQRPASSTSLPAARFASTTPQPTSGLIIRNGKAVLYRGPPPMKTWVYIFIGGVFTYSG